ncbi:(2Fe-2S)-binding protein [Nocardioides sp. GXZ039]|uniref:(2Fe-2S)-binding protein n=1 Tax=Nocardioides sp. GXZ039 TaxID=3136018 RepID=UPI0030F3955C
MTRTVRATVNALAYEAAVEDRTSLADTLRESWGLAGTRLGCEHGSCGACTVLVDGLPERGCLVLAVQVDGRDVVTVEGLADPDGGIGHLQQAFRDAHGLQCGFCTSGMLLTAQALLDEDPDPAPDRVRDWMHGNLCRCTGYDQIVEAVLLAARRVRECAGCAGCAERARLREGGA